MPPQSPGVPRDAAPASNHIRPLREIAESCMYGSGKIFSCTFERVYEKREGSRRVRLRQSRSGSQDNELKVVVRM